MTGGIGAVSEMVISATFVLFYLMTVFALAWGTSALGFSRDQFLLIQLFGVIFFALTIPIFRRARRTTWLATNYALPFVGYYLSLVATLTLVGLLLMGETKDHDLAG